MVAEHGHVGRAAEVLGLSQPALSLSLRRLEKSLHSKIVKRTPKGVELTAVGAALLSHVKRLRLAREDVMREVADLSEGRSGHLRIGVTPGITEDLAGVASAALMNEAPKATLKIIVTTSDALPTALRNGEIDLCIGSMQAASTPDIDHEHLFDDQFVVYASVKNRLAGRKRVALADLVEARWAIPNALIAGQRLNRAFEDNNLPPPRFTMESNSTAARLRAIASSDLLGFSSRGFVTQARRRFGLVELPVKEIALTRRIAVFYRKDGYLSPAARRFIEILKKAQVHRAVMQ